LSSTIVSRDQVSVLGILTTNSTDIIYYGTKIGVVKRVDGVNPGPFLTITDISGVLSNFSYVNSPSVEPTDSDNVIAVFGNYNLQSLLYSTNGGSTICTLETVSSVGNTVTVMLDWIENDRALAAGSHSKGVYSATAASPLPFELSLFSNIF